MASLESLPGPLRHALGEDAREGRLVIAVASDFSAGGEYGQEWLVVTRDRLRVYSSATGTPTTEGGSLFGAETAAPRTQLCPAFVNKRRVLPRLAGCLEPYPVQAALITLMLLSSTGPGLVTPYLSRPMMGAVLVPHAEAMAINIVQARTAAWVTHRLAHALRVELYQHLQRLSLRFR